MNLLYTNEMNRWRFIDSGANIGAVLLQLQDLPVAHPDLVLIHACANDVLEFRSLAAVERDLRAAYGRGLRSVAVVFMHAYAWPDHERQVGEIARRWSKRHRLLILEGAAYRERR